MASGCVIRYEGARGVVFRVKYHDGERQVMETLGREADGWSGQKAERALGVKLAEVERGMRKPRKRTSTTSPTEFVEVALAAKPRKKSTVIDYKATIRNHLSPTFGSRTSARFLGDRKRSSGTPRRSSRRGVLRSRSGTTSCCSG